MKSRATFSVKRFILGVVLAVSVVSVAGGVRAAGPYIVWEDFEKRPLFSAVKELIEDEKYEGWKWFYVGFEYTWYEYVKGDAVCVVGVKSGDIAVSAEKRWLSTQVYEDIKIEHVGPFVVMWPDGELFECLDGSVEFVRRSVASLVGESDYYVKREGLMRADLGFGFRTEYLELVDPQPGVTLGEKRNIKLRVNGGAGLKYTMWINGVCVDPPGPGPFTVPADEQFEIPYTAFGWRWLNRLTIQTWDVDPATDGRWLDTTGNAYWLYEATGPAGYVISPQPGYFEKGTYSFNVKFSNYGNNTCYIYGTDGSEYVVGINENGVGSGIPVNIPHSGNIILKVGDTEVWRGYYDCTSGGAVIPDPGGSLPDGGIPGFISSLNGARAIIESFFNMMPGFLRSLAIVGLTVGIGLRILGR
jgi:hypothetical protein